MTRIALLQMTSGIDPAANAATLVEAIHAAKAGRAAMLFTPEMSGLLDRDRARAAAHIVDEHDDPVLAAVRAAARDAGLWVHVGSLAVRGAGERLANRGFVIDDAGEIAARYDKMHMFDVSLSTGEEWRESAAYSPGSRSVVVETPVGMLGLSICYDIRFPALYQALSAAGATVIAVPAAFTRPTGEAHWATLLSARAIENAAFVVAAAQSGEHDDGRNTHGHSVAIGPWGDMLLDMGTDAGLGFADIDVEAVGDIRARIPVIDHRRTIPAAEVVR
ncbi:carbon-nitrogen hydrolase family protein [Sphingomonas sp. AX6]|uniref:carbon-nitrogen hydrolase family protein n=1 Tax=Sphingomonas sp. AX6 TaxID=2653171 RepID=UPI0012F176CD|nr:carbon-nitrogen hydrolase family protein [Sphingomonas sp. AX6]VXC80082.1 Deaminated glutathione amidase [Sphingomonas sp. AX6]